MTERLLPRKLRLARAERGLTLRQAARLTGVTKETLIDLEHGRRQPHPPTLFKIARGYGIPVRDLMEEAPSVEVPSLPLGEARSAPGLEGETRLDYLRLYEEALLDVDEVIRGLFAEAQSHASRDPKQLETVLYLAGLAVTGAEHFIYDTAEYMQPTLEESDAGRDAQERVYRAVRRLRQTLDEIGDAHEEVVTTPTPSVAILDAFRRRGEASGA